MDTIDIEQKISKLEAGSFQRLVGELLTKELSDFTLQLNGAKPGSLKTTKSHPDCLFISKNKNEYILVECTTEGQRKLTSKFESDINSCINNTDIPISKIRKVFFAYSTGKIPNKKIVEVTSQLESQNIALELLSVNELANRIEKYPVIAEKFLNVSPLFSPNIMTVEEFVDESKNNFSPSLDKVFFSREKEIRELNDLIQDEGKNIIILFGVSGVGKTKLALEFLKTIEHNYNKITCLKYNTKFDSTELLKIINSSSFFLIDDADKFDDISDILYFLKDKKVILTIRDYNLNYLRKKLENYNNCYSTLEVKPFDAKSIGQILSHNHKEINKEFLLFLNDVTKGNIRLAFMLLEACKNDTNFVKNIYKNVSIIFGKYYESRIDIILNNKESLKKHLNVLGLITFKQSVVKSKISEYKTFFRFFNISFEDFQNTIDWLEKEQFVKIEKDESISICDQCFNDYLCFYLYFSKRIISLNNLLSTFFPNYKKNLIDLLNLVLNNFKDNTTVEYIKSEIDISWNHLKINDNIHILQSFSASFSSLIPQKAYYLLQSHLKQNTICDEEWVISSFISVIHNIDSPKSALQLFKVYLQKKVISFEKAEEILIRNFNISYNNLVSNNYSVQNEIVSVLSQNFKEFNQYLTSYCMQLLKFFFESHEFKNEKLAVRTYRLKNSSSELYKIREKCIRFLSSSNNVYNILLNYFRQGPNDDDIEIFKNDIDIFNEEISKQEKNEQFEIALYFYSNKIFSYLNIKWDFLYQRNKQLIDFLSPILFIPCYRNINVFENEQKYDKTIIDEIKKNPSKTITRIEKCIEIDRETDCIRNMIVKFFDLSINNINSDYLLPIVNILLKEQWFSVSTSSIDSTISRYKKEYGVKKTFEFINNDLLDIWKARAFESLFLYLKDMELNDKTKTLFIQYINQIDKYKFTKFHPQLWLRLCQGDNALFLHICEKALNFEKEGKKGNYFLDILFEDSFENNLFEILFTLNPKFLEDVYLYYLEHKIVLYDENGTYIIRLIKNNIGFLDNLYPILITLDFDNPSLVIIADAIWNDENYICYVDKLFNNLLKERSKYSMNYRSTNIMGGIRLSRANTISNHQLLWVEHVLKKNFSDTNIILCLFNCLGDFDDDSKLKCLELLLKYTRNIELFKSINLHSTFAYGVSSMETSIQLEIQFYKKILQKIPDDMKYYEHRLYVNEIIDEEKKKKEQIIPKEKDLNF